MSSKLTSCWLLTFFMVMILTSETYAFRLQLSRIPRRVLPYLFLSSADFSDGSPPENQIERSTEPSRFDVCRIFVTGVIGTEPKETVIIALHEYSHIFSQLEPQPICSISRMAIMS